MNDTHAEAHKLHRAGLPITLCPPDSKKPLGEGWDANRIGLAWQKKRWTLKEIDRAFKLRGALNVGVLFGPESKLIDIEEDSPEDRTAYSQLMQNCPPATTATFSSKRGPHRLFAWRPELEKLGKATIHFDGLEIKIGANGKGAHSLFPPSVSGGVVREWLNPLDDCPAARFPDRAVERLFEARLTDVCQTAAVVVVVEKEEEAELTQTHSTACVSVSTVSLCKPPLTVAEVIRRTLPSKVGHRRNQIFTCVRHLKALPQYASADLPALLPVVRQWHSAALPFIGTKDFDATFADFADAWINAKFAVGEGPLKEVYMSAISKPLPNRAERYECDSLRRMVLLCRELQHRAGREPFYLACRSAGDVLGVTHVVANKWLRLLVHEGMLELVTPGTRHQATEYRYIED